MLENNNNNLNENTNENVNENVNTNENVNSNEISTSNYNFFEDDEVTETVELNETEITETNEIIETKFVEENQTNNNVNNVSENVSDEEIPNIITKKQTQINNQPDYFDRRYYAIQTTPEDGYNKLIQSEEKSEKNIYRWSLESEENRMQQEKLAKKFKKARKNLGIKIFAGVMSAMFAFTALTSGYLLWDRAANNNINYVAQANATDNSTGANGENAENIDLTNTALTVPKAEDTEKAKELSTNEVIKKMKPSVVCIQVEVTVSQPSYWGRGGGSYVETGVGSGFILTSDGYIATNYHVIDGATKITVMMNDGKEYAGTLIGGDETADLAVIKIEAKNLPVAEIGNSAATEEGDFVVAIGSPGGIEFAGSSTFGMISAVNREIQVDETKKMTLLQTDASINPGNSGGPLVNLKGQVIGINTLKLASNLSTQYEGMGFAIPINSAITKINDIIANPSKYVNGGAVSTDNSTVSFGIAGRTIDAETAQQNKIPQGFYIEEVNVGGACDNTGIKSGDIIVALDGKTVASFDDLAELKMNYKVGDKAVVTVYRDGERVNFTINFKAKQ